MTNVLRWERLLPRQARLRLDIVSVRSERLTRRQYLTLTDYHGTCTANFR
jgi:hypothetical protein